MLKIELIVQDKQSKNSLGIITSQEQGPLNGIKSALRTPNKQTEAFVAILRRITFKISIYFKFFRFWTEGFPRVYRG